MRVFSILGHGQGTHSNWKTTAIIHYFYTPADDGICKAVLVQLNMLLILSANISGTVGRLTTRAFINCEQSSSWT